MPQPSEKKAWVITVDMGYGHQRVAYPLKHLAFKDEIIKANHYLDIPNKDRVIWERSRLFYESISNLKRIPLVGEFIFKVYDKFQKIPQFYPKRDLSKPDLVLKNLYSLIKKGWGKHLIEKLKKENSRLPFLTTFFAPAFMAEVFEYPGEIFCIVCDADISRTWAPLEPSNSKIKYLVPNERVKERLDYYGVKKENILLTGCPLPAENIGENCEILKRDLAFRLFNLDPKKKYFENYQTLIFESLGILPKKSDHPLTILFSIGGAGAQKEIALKAIKRLAQKIENSEIKFIVSAGIKSNVRDYFTRIISSLNVEIIYEPNIGDYFEKFNQALQKTDILWTKPSELSFYCGLGIPIIIAPTIGSQEDFNREWLLKLGSGILQENPSYVEEWLFDLLKSGWLAEAAMQGFIEAEKMGTYNITKIVNSIL